MHRLDALFCLLCLLERNIQSELFQSNIVILFITQAAAVTATVVLITLGGIVGHDLAPTPALSTLPLLMFAIGTAATTVLATWTMAHIGRARGFACGAGIGFAGSPLPDRGAVWRKLRIVLRRSCIGGLRKRLCPAVPFRGGGKRQFGVSGVGRVDHSLRIPDWCCPGSGACRTWRVLGVGIRFAGSFCVVAGCYLFAAVLLLWLRNPRPATSSAGLEEVRPLREIARNRFFLVAILGAAIGYGVMTLVMTAVPLAMHVVDGHSLVQTATVIQAHVLAMYAPSLVTGLIITRFGSKSVMLTGAIILCLAVITGFAGREVLHYGASMIALGVGWNFLYVGGTTLLGSTHRPGERFIAQACNDFTVFGITAAAALSAGIVMQLYGWNAVLWASVPAIALAMVTLTWVRPNRKPGLTGV